MRRGLARRNALRVTVKQGCPVRTYTLRGTLFEKDPYRYLYKKPSGAPPALFPDTTHLSSSPLSPRTPVARQLSHPPVLRMEEHVNSRAIDRALSNLGAARNLITTTLVLLKDEGVTN